MNRFLVVFSDGRPSVSLKSMFQVETFLKNSVPDAKDAGVYELKHNAIRNGWTFCSPHTQSKTVTRTARSKPVNGEKPLKKSRWSSAETKLAIDLWNKGKSAPEIGVVLNRSPRSVYQKLSRYRSSLTR